MDRPRRQAPPGAGPPAGRSGSGPSPSSAGPEALLGGGRSIGAVPADRGAPALPSGLLPRAIATLDPGYFAWVMASGIVSVGTDLLGYQVLSQVILVVTVVAFVALVAAYTARALWFTPFFRRSLQDPSVAMAYFTFVAGADVLGVRLAMAGYPAFTAALALAASAVWLVLNYGLPWSIVARAHRPVLREFNGTWFVWVVGTQSLAIAAASLVSAWQGSELRQDLAETAVCLWGVGIVLYLVLVVIILLRLMVVEVTPAEMGPAYWIAMGATAISVRAAAGILALPHQVGSLPIVELHPFMVGISVVLWSFGTWWIPLLVLFGLWRHGVRRYPLSYEPRLWSMVFPLGMYTVASYSLGKAAGIGFMVDIARVWVFVDVAAWVAVLLLMVTAAARTLASPGHR